MAGWEAFGGAPSEDVQAAPVQAAAPAMPSWDAFGGAPSDQPAPVPVAPAPAPASRFLAGMAAQNVTPEQGAAISAGLDRGFRDVIDRPAAWLGGSDVAAGNTADRQAYEAQYGQSPESELGRLGGQSLIALPVAGALGGLATGGGNLLAAGGGRLSPLLGNVVQGTTNFLGGAFGGAGGIGSRLGQAGSVVANSALQGGEMAALTAGQSDQSLGSQALQGAMTGAIVGPPIRAAGAGLGALAGSMSKESAAQKDIARAIARDQTTPDELQQQAMGLAALRPNATIADVGGENVRGLVERVAQTPGAGRTVVVPALTDTQQAQMGRIAGDLKGMTGTSQTAIEALNDAMTQRATAAKPLYQQSMGFNPTTDPTLVKTWEDATQSGWGKAALSSPTLRRNMASEHGLTDLSGPPSMELMDSWKKVMDDLASNASRQGNNNSARIISTARDKVVNALDQANPVYAQARSAWAGPSQYMDALESGKNIASGKLSAEELQNQLAGMTDAEREAFRTGAVTSLVSKMGNDPAKMADMTKYFRSPEMRAKVAALMPTQAAADNWNSILDYEVSSSTLTGRALGGPATARRVAETADASSISGDLIREGLGMAITGGVGGSKIWKAAIGAARMARDAARSKSDEIVGRQLIDPALRNQLVDFLARGTPAQTNALSQYAAPLSAIVQGQMRR